MKVEATSQIIDWDAENSCTVVLNVGDIGELSEAMAEKHKGSWKKAKADKPQADQDADSKPKAERKPPKKKDEAPTELGEARSRYYEAFGKRPGPSWTVEQIDAKIADKQASENAAPADGAADENEADAPPV